MRNIPTKKTEEKFSKIKYALSERVKELSVLQETSKLLVCKQKDISEVLNEFIKIIPKAWKYPETTAVRIVYQNHEFTTPNYINSQWKLKEFFTTVEKDTGFIEVIYTEERPTEFEGPFLKEEKDL